MKKSTRSRPIAGLQRASDETSAERLTSRRARHLRKEAVYVRVKNISSDASARRPTARPVGNAPVNGDATLRLVRKLSHQLPERRVAELETEFGSIDNVVKLLLIGLPTKNSLDDLVGPFRDTSNLIKFLGVGKRQTIEERVKAGTLLCVRSGDNKLMYPAFQFDEDRKGLPRLNEVLNAFDADRKNAWDAALWLAQADHDLGGQTPAEALRGDDSDLVIELARRAGAALAA